LGGNGGYAEDGGPEVIDDATETLPHAETSATHIQNCIRKGHTAYRRDGSPSNL
jgi:hypothetical protein